jgi:hypothetical protein
MGRQSTSLLVSSLSRSGGSVPWGTGFYFSPGASYGPPCNGFKKLMSLCCDWLPSLALPFLTMIIDALVHSYGSEDARIARHRQWILEESCHHSERSFVNGVADLLYQIYLHLSVHHSHHIDYTPSIMIILDCLLLLPHDRSYFHRICQVSYHYLYNSFIHLLLFTSFTLLSSRQCQYSL